MGSLFSLLVSVVALLTALPVFGQGAPASAARDAALSRARLEQALSRQAEHARAIASGDLSRSPYHRFRGPSGQSGSRHDETAWYRELIARG